MAISNINTKLLLTDYSNQNGYQTLKESIKKDKITEISKRDVVYLVNKQMEGISETNGNLFIYMFYFFGYNKNVKWYNSVRANDIGAGGTKATESTPWCGCYLSFVLNASGISGKGSANSNGQTSAHSLKTQNKFKEAKSMDVMQFGKPGQGHTSFLVKEDENKPNGYNKPFYQFGGNQSDSVRLSTPPSPKYKLNSFGNNDKYDDKISTGDVLSLLGFLDGLNTKNTEERKNEINARLEDNKTLGTEIEKEIKEIRTLIGEEGLGLKINNTSLQTFFKSLITFEDSLVESGLPLTENIRGVIDKSREGSTR